MAEDLETGLISSRDEKAAVRNMKSEQDKLAFGKPTAELEWDGIRKLDYPPPRWWVMTFIATVVIAAIWWVLYPSWPSPFGTWRGVLGYDQRAAVETRLAEAERARAPLVAALDAATIEQVRADPQLFNYAVLGGQVAFNNYCAPCHGLGGGGQGAFPTLADDDWLWGGRPDDIEYTIRHGIRSGTAEARDSIMPAFGVDGILARDQIRDVTQYTLSLTGRATDADAVARGEEVFVEQCAACHGEGGVGNQEVGAPQLSNEVWLYGGEPQDIAAQVIRPQHGVMPAFGTRLDDATVKMLVVYVHSLGGGQ